jgi:TolA-binding protein
MQALGISAAVTTVAATSTSTATAATTGGLSLLAKIAGVSILASGLVAGGLWVRGSHRSAPASQPATTPAPAVVAPPGDPEPERPARGEPPASASSSASATPARVGNPSRPARTASPDDRLSQEVVALERAHQALASHDPDAALRKLDEYRAQFPGGVLSSDATVLRVQALLAKGDLAGARTLADAYSSAHPDSPYAKRIEDLVRGGQKK